MEPHPQCPRDRRNPDRQLGGHGFQPSRSAASYHGNVAYQPQHRRQSQILCGAGSGCHRDSWAFTHRHAGRRLPIQPCRRHAAAASSSCRISRDRYRHRAVLGQECAGRGLGRRTETSSFRSLGPACGGSRLRESQHGQYAHRRHTDPSRARYTNVRGTVHRPHAIYESRLAVQHAV